MLRPAYKRILLKLSGESLMGESSYGVDSSASFHIASQVKHLLDLQVQVGIVIGGGNFFRGASGPKAFSRSCLDQAGMLATVMNGLMLREVFEQLNVSCKLMSAFSCSTFVEPFDCKKALLYLQEGHCVIFVGGTGNPYFTTDSCASLRALEIGAECLFKATKVDGIYDKDPRKFSDAKKYQTITYDDVLRLNLQVMDATAIALCRENKMPIRVFNVFSNEDLFKAVCNQPVGTIVNGKL